MGKVVMYSSVSVDGFVADENDQPGPLFDWLSSGDVPLDESGELKVSQASYDYTRPYWNEIGATIAGRHVFDMTDGWDGKPPVPLDESGELKVSQASYDYTRPYWNEIGATIAGRHVFDMTDGWDGKPPGGIDHVVVVTHRPKPEGWDPEAPFHFVDGVEAAVAKARGLGPRGAVSLRRRRRGSRGQGAGARG